MRIWVDIEDGSGNKVGAGPLRHIVRCTLRERLSRAGQYEIQLAGAEPRADLATVRRTALVYGLLGGQVTFLGGGMIDEVQWRLRENGQAAPLIRGGDLLRELSRLTVGDLEMTGNATVNIAAIMAPAVANLGWSLSPAGTPPGFQGRLVYETVLGGLVETAEKVGFMFRRETSLGGNIRNVSYFMTNTDSGVLATTHGDPDAMRANPNACVITDIEIVEQSYDLKNQVYVWGAGDGESRLSLAQATQFPDGTALTGSYFYRGAYYQCDQANNFIFAAQSRAQYGVDEAAVQFSDIAPLSNSDADVEAAGNFLVVAALEWLHKYSLPYTSYRLRVTGLQKILKPGQTIRVQARRYRDGEKIIDVDEELVILETETTVDQRGVRTTGLMVATVARWPVAGEYVARELAQARVMRAHPQMGPNVDTITYREHVDDDHNATLYFWLGEETTTVANVTVRLRVDPLRSTVTTEGGGIDIDAELPAHQHALQITEVPSYAAHVGVEHSGGTGFLAHEATGAGHIAIFTQPGIYSGNEPAIINIAGNVDLSTAYGVFDESNANTYQATELEYSVNGGGWTAITSNEAISGASGWYGLDITSLVSDSATKRPVSVVNTIAFRVADGAKAGHSAQITAQIERRTTIQSIATF